MYGMNWTIKCRSLVLIHGFGCIVELISLRSTFEPVQTGASTPWADEDQLLHIQHPVPKAHQPPIIAQVPPHDSSATALPFSPALVSPYSDLPLTPQSIEGLPGAEANLPLAALNRPELDQVTMTEGDTWNALHLTPSPEARGFSGHSSSDSISSMSGRAYNTRTRPEQAGMIAKDYAFVPFPSIHNTPPSRAHLTQSLTGSPSIISFVTCPEDSEGAPRTPSRVAFAELPANIPRCDSPFSISNSLRPRRKPAISSLRESTVAAPILGLRAITLLETKPSRKILIIGSSYDRDERRTATMFSITTLDAALGDKEDLKDAFRQRGYSVHSLVNSHFTRQDVLEKIAQFLRDACSGDVRAVVFTGHAVKNDGQVMLVPPHCPGDKDAISENDWEDNIRKHAKPGVVVFSILAHCLGDFMTQELDLQNDLAEQDRATHSGGIDPIFITFSATSKGTSAYESMVATDTSRVTDHFIHALLNTLRSNPVHDWESFFHVFQGNFAETRAAVSRVYSLETLGDSWEEVNPQHPRFSASRGVVSGLF
ncbi:hypothetical protein FRC09_001769 [Ceratobasidium sp. 395]|nr:hypothetical protein FRC09_001769 [Ceratobasidium sp. 395]